MMKWTVMVLLMLIVFSLSNCEGGDEFISSISMAKDEREHQHQHIDDSCWRRVMEAEMRQLKNRVKQLELFNHIIIAHGLLQVFISHRRF
jgi:hypothetical protein